MANQRTKLKTNQLPKDDREVINRAVAFAMAAHAGQTRKSGEAYVMHPLAVAQILIDWGMDTDTIVAGLLHDTVEDTDATLEGIEQSFGQTVARLVDGVTKIGHIRMSKTEYSREAQSVENLRKLLLAMSRDVRVMMIKLADRLHNLRTLEHLTPEKQIRIARESLQVFAPLADRLGMGALKAEIEDICFSYLDPARFSEVEKEREQRIRAAEGDYEELVAYLKKRTIAAGINADITTRVKHIYSIHKKLIGKGADIGTVYDIMAARVIVDEIRQCYEVLGIVHEQYKPLIYRIKDFIAVPKPNGYQSLHSTVLSPSGSIFEVQIRTRQMHEEAERGLAAHFFYDQHKQTKQYSQGGTAMMPKKLEWVGSLMDWQEKGDGEFREDLARDLFSDRIFVFSPLGDLYDLPEGATPIDFAFAVHGLLGYRAKGARVNGSIVGLDYKLGNRDIVEIIAGRRETGPSRDWLNFVRTAKAKNKIRAWYRRQDRDTNLQIGRELVQDELDKMRLPHLEKLTALQHRELYEHFNHHSLESLLLSVGEGQIRASAVVARLATHQPKRRLRFFKTGLQSSQPLQYSIEIGGDRSMPYTLAKCCMPQPGQPIVARTSRDAGIVVHRINCRQIDKNDAQLLPASWYQQKGEQTYHIRIIASDRVNLLGDVTSRVADLGMSIVSINSNTKSAEPNVHIDMSVQAASVAELTGLMQQLEQVASVKRVQKR